MSKVFKSNFHFKRPFHFNATFPHIMEIHGREILALKVSCEAVPDIVGLSLEIKCQ